MGFIDFSVNRFFRDEPQGRVVLLDGAIRGHGYLVRSASDEHRIRAFLRMAVPNFVSPADVVTISRRPLDRARYVALAVLALLPTVLAVIAVIAAVTLVRAR